MLPHNFWDVAFLVMSIVLLSSPVKVGATNDVSCEAAHFMAAEAVIAISGEFCTSNALAGQFVKNTELHSERPYYTMKKHPWAPLQYLYHVLKNDYREARWTFGTSFTQNDGPYVFSTALTVPFTGWQQPDGCGSFYISNTNCQICPYGKWAPANSNVQTDCVCPGGTELTDGMCTGCKEGTYKGINGGDHACEPCA